MPICFNADDLNCEDWSVYHRGFLATDRMHELNKKLDEFSSRLLDLAANGDVFLAQRRLDRFQFEYLVKRAK